MEKRAPSLRLSKMCSASPDTVYETIAEVSSHLDWGGSKQRRDFRLLSLDCPDGPASAGLTFESTGAIPMSSKRWEDRSTVTEAVRPRVFEFVTQSRAGSGAKAMTARFINRYEIAAVDGRSKVTYTQTQEQISNPFLRLALPGLRQMMWRFGIPMFARRGFSNLIESAEAAARIRPPKPAAASGHR